MKRKVISIVVVFAMFLSVVSISVSAETNDLSGGQLLRQYVLENDVVEKSVTSTELTKEDEANINAGYLQSFIDSNEMAKQSYGGCYIGDDNKLCVLFTENTGKEVINEVYTMTNNSVLIKNCEYSLEELTALREYVGNIMSVESFEPELTAIANDIVSVGIDTKENKLLVGIKECSNEKIAVFKDLILDSDAVMFKSSNGIKVQSALWGGTDIEIVTSGGTRGYSVGFRCRYLKPTGSYVNGFMTAAHNNSAGDAVYTNNDYIGFIMAYSYNNNGRMDCSFVYVTNSDYVPSNQLTGGAGTLVAGAYIQTYTVGATVYLAGATSIYLSGKITDTSMIAECNTGFTIHDCVEVNYVCRSGDSGGVVYRKQNGSNYVTGLNMGSVQNDYGQDVASVFVKISNIKEVFDIVLY